MQCGAQPAAIATESRTVSDGKGQLQQCPSRRRIPEPQDAVPGVGGEQAALRVKRQHLDILHVALQGRHLALGGHVPDLNARVGAGNGQALPVRVPGDGLEVHRTHGQFREEIPARHIVDGNGAGVFVADRQFAVVRVKRQRRGLCWQVPAVHFLPRLQIKAEDLLLLADRQLPAVRAESIRQPAAGWLVAEDRLPVGHAPHVQRAPGCDAEQEPLVGAEIQVIPVEEWARGDAPDLPIVGETADADEPQIVRAGIDAVLPAQGDRGGAGRRAVPAWHAADVGQRHRGNGFVAQHCVRSDTGGLVQSVRLSNRWPAWRLKRRARACS